MLAERLRRGSLYVFDYGEAGPSATCAGCRGSHLPRRAARRRSALGAGHAGHHGRRRLRRDPRAAGEAAGLQTVLDEPQPAWLRRHGALEEAATLPPTSEQRLWLEALAREDGAGASFRVLVQTRP